MNIKNAFELDSIFRNLFNENYEMARDILDDFIKEYGFSVVEMKLAHGGLAPIGVMIAQKVA